MAFFVRGGRPQHINGTTAAVPTVEKWPLQGPSVDLTIHNLDAATTLEVFFTKLAADAGVGNGLLIGPGMGWQGPLECIEFWTYAAASMSFRALALTRP